MAQRVGTGIAEAWRIGCGADAEGIHDQDECACHGGTFLS